jgi:fimbrial chaperone protein
MNSILALAALPFLMAFSFAPMSQSIDLGDKQKATQFLIENTTPEKIAVELSVRSRSMDEQGVETQAETKEITIFPPQLIVPPGEKRTIRVSWNGPLELSTEKNFRVIAEQLGLKVDEKTKNKSGIKMLMKYVAALYVTPDNAGPELKVLSHKSDGKILELTLENKGTKHQILGEPQLSFEIDGKKKTLKAEDLKGLPGENVLAGTKRTFRVPSSLQIPANTKLSIKVNE